MAELWLALGILKYVFAVVIVITSCIIGYAYYFKRKERPDSYIRDEIISQCQKNKPVRKQKLYFSGKHPFDRLFIGFIVGIFHEKEKEDSKTFIAYKKGKIDPVEVFVAKPGDLGDLKKSNVYINGTCFAPQYEGMYYLSKHFSYGSRIISLGKDKAGKDRKEYKYNFDELQDDVKIFSQNAISASPSHQKMLERTNMFSSDTGGSVTEPLPQGGDTGGTE